MNRKAFTLIELLVVVAIIGILAAVGVVAYNGYTSSAKKSAATTNHKNVVKYITTEVMKCSTGAATAMNNELDCSKQGLNNWKDFVAQAVERSLSGFKNPYFPSELAVTHGGSITNDKFVGYNRMLSPGLKIEVMTCVITPCSGTRCQGDNHLCSGDIILD
tara:strand:- start:220 stop:702 length:483 start_codon:yes stop_codon:yes gene_type:complete